MIQENNFHGGSMNYTNTNVIEHLPEDYFYKNEYDYLTLPEVQLLLLLSDTKKVYSFSGLKKSAELHQHRLNKSIKRLQERDLLKKRKDGDYELTEDGSVYTHNLINTLIKNEALKISPSPVKSAYVRYTLIPPLSKEKVASLFEKRWFDNFRYLYKKESEERITICWENENNDQLLAHIEENGEIIAEYKSKKPENNIMFHLTNWMKRELEARYKVKMERQKRKKYNDREVYN